MIKVEVKKDTITIKGHAMYDEAGKDIVCASVSSIATTTINAILSINEKSITYKVDDGYILINIINRNEVIDKLINNMIDLFKDLEKDYKKYIKVMEV